MHFPFICAGNIYCQVYKKLKKCNMTACFPEHGPQILSVSFFHDACLSFKKAVVTAELCIVK